MNYDNKKINKSNTEGMSLKSGNHTVNRGDLINSIKAKASGNFGLKDFANFCGYYIDPYGDIIKFDFSTNRGYILEENKWNYSSVVTSNLKNNHEFYQRNYNFDDIYTIGKETEELIDFSRFLGKIPETISQRIKYASEKLGNYLTSLANSDGVVDKNDGTNLYYLMSNGYIFKTDKTFSKFYSLDLDNLMWRYDSVIYEFFYDGTHQYIQMPEFIDAYETEELDYRKTGRH